MKAGNSILGGTVGAGALTIIHETLRRVVPGAPRMDLLGMMALSKTLRHFGKTPPSGRKLFYITMAGDLVSNALFYSIAGAGKKRNAIWKGLSLGFSAGLGAVLLPKPLHLDPTYSRRTPKTALLTIALYTVGGIMAGWAIQKLFSEKGEN